MLKIILVIFISISSVLGVNRGIINISDLDVEMEVAFDVGQFQEDYAVDSYFVGVSILDTDDGEGPSLVSANLLVINDMPESDGSKLGFGAKIVSTEHNDGINTPESFLAMPIGAVLDYRVPSDQELFWKTEVFYAPGALSFKDARYYAELRTSIEIEAIENVRVFLGVRGIYVRYHAANKQTINESIMGGMQIGF